MKVHVLKVFGREVLRLESHDEATVSDVVKAMIAHRLSRIEVEVEDDDEELVECECCGEMFDPAEAEAQAIVDDQFEEIAENLNWGERMVWDARPPDDDES